MPTTLRGIMNLPLDTDGVTLLKAVRRRRFGLHTCFLCAARLTKANRTEEHVFPKWLQRRHNLWTQRLDLLNGTPIQYRHLTVPCCAECNHLWLSRIENVVCAATEDSVEAVRNLPKDLVFRWLGKIVYGILYRELFLLVDRAVPRRGRIINRALLRQFAQHHFFLMGARLPMQLLNGSPYSLLTFRVQETGDSSLDWWFGDLPHSLFIALRTKGVGFIAILQDGGVGADFFRSFPEKRPIEEMNLHPLQFRQLAAEFAYKNYLLIRPPIFLVTGKDPIQVVKMPLVHPGSLFHPWEQREYALALSRFIGTKFSDIYREPDLVGDLFHHPDGAPIKLDVKEVSPNAVFAIAPQEEGGA